MRKTDKKKIVEMVEGRDVYFDVPDDGLFYRGEIFIYTDDITKKEEIFWCEHGGQLLHGCDVIYLRDLNDVRVGDCRNMGYYWYYPHKNLKRMWARLRIGAWKGVPTANAPKVVPPCRLP